MFNQQETFTLQKMIQDGSLISVFVLLSLNLRLHGAG